MTRSRSPCSCSEVSSAAARREARRLARRSSTDRAADDVQRDLLLSRLARHADSQFGRDHHFAEIRTPADFRRRVPVRGYDGHEPYIDRVRNGDTSALFGPGTEVLMFAMTSGTTNRPKTIPVTRESLRDYREGWTIWGILAFDAHFDRLRRGLKPILQLASDWRESFTPSGIPCGAITGLTAQMQNPLVRLDLLHAARRLADQGHRGEVLRRAPALGPPRPRRDDRRQPEHPAGHRPARRPREGDPDPRLRRRHDRRQMGPPARRPRGAPAADAAGSGRRSPGGSKRSSTGPAGSSPRTTGPT